MNMRQWGIFLLVIGGLSVILPFVGLQFKLLSIFGNASWIGSLVLCAAGVILFGIGTD